ncbi:MAG: glycosyltransferase family 4 protein [Simkania sp.]|nr:glycosyltransferase family 4 protein [Simkania sp.]
MKRLLFIKQEILPKGGLEKYARNLVQAFIKQGCEVTILSATPNIPSFEGAKVVYLPLYGLLGFHRLLRWDTITQAYVEKHSFDVVFSLDRVTCPTYLRTGNGVHASYLKHRQEGLFKRLSFRINPLHRTLLRLEKNLFSSPKLKKIIVNSRMVRQELEEFYHVDSSRIAIHHNGVEWKELQTPFDQWELTKAAVCDELSLPEENFLFLFVGHHYRRKGLGLILHSFSMLKEGHLLIAGKDREIPYYKKLAQDLNLKNRVSFLGPRHDITRLYAVADALVVPSLYDPFANVTVEALAMGLFVVSSPFNGGKEILTSSSGTIIEDLLDSDSVKNAFNEALLHPKTAQSATAIRNHYASLDFSIHLPKLVQECLM